MKLLEQCCRSSSFTLSVSLLRGARVAEVVESLADLLDVHSVLVAGNGRRWFA